jgi:hypothetical protein
MGGASLISKVFSSTCLFGNPHLDLLWRTASQIMENLLLGIEY